ncbi:hypothetical protein CCACVL1_03359 [Corchorus capsularis]|uniref:Uncharacterized protein n=1 Tax=Corchorus capsularis TaxID=210143 RepID=A0A1R3JZX2_COCAP|nr:hypothetical protein CCACVL1_03359 [Corchorus capsularis]
MSPTLLPRQEQLFYCDLFGGFGQERQKRDAFYQSKKSGYCPPPMLPRSTYRGIEREDPGPEQVGLGYRAVSAVGGDKGRARTVHRRVRRTPEMTAMSRNLTHWPKRRANTRTATNVEHTTMPPVFISWKSPAEERAALPTHSDNALNTRVCSSAPFSHAESQAAPRKARASYMQGNLHVWFWPGTPSTVGGSQCPGVPGDSF